MLDYLETKTTGIESEANYNRLGYGFCVFCEPEGDCQTEFALYQLTGINDSPFEWVGRMAKKGQLETV